MDDENDRPQYAIPLTSPSAIKETRTTTTAYHSPTVPIVRTTLPSEDLLDEQKNAVPRILPEITKPTPNAFAITEKRQLPSGIAQPKHSRQKTHNIVASSALKARKFHLVNSPSSSIPSPFLNPKPLAQKHRKSRRKDLAVFVEKRIEKKRKAKGITGDHHRSRPDSSCGLRNIDSVFEKEDDISQLEKPPRKLPNATAAERKWRTETWANRPPKRNEVDGNVRRTAENINEPSSRWDYESSKLAEQLQEVALEEIRASEERRKGLSDGGGKLKVKPKPPKPRQSRIEKSVEDDDGSGDGDDVMTDTVYLDDDDGDYVLDTYVRSSAAEPPFGITTEPAESEDHDSVLRSVDHHGNVGILVIENEEEEAIWEAFAEDQEESDPEWNSEEEDENGTVEATLEDNE